MEHIVSSCVVFWEKYNLCDLSQKIQQGKELSEEEKYVCLTGENPSRVRIKEQWYDIAPLSFVARTVSNIDGYYHYLYIQINWTTNEYYIGKVNRKHWRELKRYQGSGIRFKRKYQTHRDEFVRYFFAFCETQQETEMLEAAIVDRQLLADTHCLNLVCGGGGTNEHFGEEKRKQKLREYMIKHPEQYQAMLNKARAVYQSGTTDALKNRAKSIRETMSHQSYRDAFRQRIKNWKEANPEQYELAREKNSIAGRTQRSREKRRKSRCEWIANNPEKHAEYQKKLMESRNTPEARAKRSVSLKKWNELHPEEARHNTQKRSEASIEKTRKRVNMLDLNTGEILMTFDSQTAAAQWLVDKKMAKNLNCKSSISAVCLKKACSTGYGVRTKAYGFGWEFAD